MFSRDELKALERIIDNEGDCLDYTICVHCPFKSTCHVELLMTKGKSPNNSERLHTAISAILNLEILNEDVDSNTI